MPTQPVPNWAQPGVTAYVVTPRFVAGIGRYADIRQVRIHSVTATLIRVPAARDGSDMQTFRVPSIPSQGIHDPRCGDNILMFGNDPRAQHILKAVAAHNATAAFDTTIDATRIDLSQVAHFEKLDATIAANRAALETIRKAAEEALAALDGITGTTAAKPAAAPV